MLKPAEHRGRGDARLDDLQRDAAMRALLLGLVDEPHGAFADEGEDPAGADALGVRGAGCDGSRRAEPAYLRVLA